MRNNCKRQCSNTSIISYTGDSSLTFTDFSIFRITDSKISVLNKVLITDISDSLPTEIKEKNGTVMAEIDNEKGVKLPETGGMGTTLFVLGGGVTVALAGIYLISKKRTTDAE